MLTNIVRNLKSHTLAVLQYCYETKAILSFMRALCIDHLKTVWLAINGRVPGVFLNLTVSLTRSLWSAQSWESAAQCINSKYDSKHPTASGTVGLGWSEFHLRPLISSIIFIHQYSVTLRTNETKRNTTTQMSLYNKHVKTQTSTTSTRWREKYLKWILGVRINRLNICEDMGKI